MSLEGALSSIIKYLKPNKIIVVDHDSTDDTRSIAQRYGATIINDTVSLGSARKRGIESSRSELIVFIDDDVMIEEGFREKMRSFFSDEVGAVQGLAVGERYIRKQFEPYELQRNRRGYTNSTIIRRRLLEDVEIDDMNAYEDWVIAQHIIGKGFEWMVVPVYSLHYHRRQSTYRHAAWNYAGIWRLAQTGRLGVSSTLNLFCSTWFGNAKLLITSDAYGDFRSFIFMMAGIALSPLFSLHKNKR